MGEKGKKERFGGVGGEESPQAVRVCCRVRPALPSESMRCCTEITSFNGMRMIQLNDVGEQILSTALAIIFAKGGIDGGLYLGWDHKKGGNQPVLLDILRSL